MAPLPQMAQEHRCKVSVLLGSQHREAMADGPESYAGQPLLEPETKRGSNSPIDDCDRARCATEEDRLDKRPVHGGLEPRRVLIAPAHESSAPPPKLKKLRKKDEAAKAIDRPKMIWMRRRNPPAVSPNASVNPVVMMMITATILATGPWTESRTFWRGSSHGIPEPAAWA